jgi:hypothetical protein
MHSTSYIAPRLHHASPSSLVVEQCILHWFGSQKIVGLASRGKNFSLMVSVTLIFEAFKHVAKIRFLIMEHFLGNYIFCLISPWWLAWYPSKLVTLRIRVAIGGFLEGSSYHSPLILTSLHTSSPLFPHLFGFRIH